MSKALAIQDEPDNQTKISVEWVKSLDLKETLKLIDEDIQAIEKHGMRLGMLIIHAQELGHDTSALMRRPIMKAARNVALGFLAVEAFSAFHANKDVLHRLVDLPKEKQIELVNKGSVPVCEIAGKETTHRLVDVAKLSPAQAQLVFDKQEHKVRTVEEQAQRLSARRLDETVISLRTKIKLNPKTNRIDAENASPEQLRDFLKKNGL